MPSLQKRMGCGSANRNRSLRVSRVRFVQRNLLGNVRGGRPALEMQLWKFLFLHDARKNLLPGLWNNSNAILTTAKVRAMLSKLEVPMRNILLLGIVLTLSGCATTFSRFETADGDKAFKFSGSTLGKQDAQQKTNFIAYPNNSGLELQDGAVTSQDTTSMIPLLQAVVTAFAQTQAVKPPAAPAEASRVDQLSAQIEALRTILDEIRGPPK